MGSDDRISGYTHYTYGNDVPAQAWGDTRSSWLPCHRAMREYHARPRLPDHGTMQQVHRELDAEY